MRGALIGVLVVTAACRPLARSEPTLDGVAERYVRLALAVGVHEAEFVDAYHGPEEWRARAQAERLPLAEIGARARRVIADLETVDASRASELVRLRRDLLAAQLGALATRVEMLGGTRFRFDEESRLLFGAVLGEVPAAEVEQALAALDARLPGEGPVARRLEAYRARFEIPPDRVAAVFDAALAEARRRTREHIALPEGEACVLEYVQDKPWGAYNWFQGDGRSLIQINMDSPKRVDEALALVTHEGYPGHHVHQILLEQELLRRRGWVEYSIIVLYAPQSLVAEGIASYAIEVAFPGAEQRDFARRVLFPLAGLDPADADALFELHAILRTLRVAGYRPLRRYLDGELDREAFVAELVRYWPMTPERALLSLPFVEKYRSYIVNYVLGEDLVRAWVARRGGAADPSRRWQAFEELLRSPRVPSNLR